jgi:hypothetical protein
MVLSRLSCYAVLAALAILLLVAFHPTSGAQGRAAVQSSHGAVRASGGPLGLALSRGLNWVSESVWTLRRRMHDTWLFLYVFGAVWVVVLAWGLMERNRLKLEVGRSEVYWMGWMSLSVISTAILYGMGTNGILARRYPRAVGISDALALGFVLALPVFAWSRLHRQREEEPEGEDPAILHRRRFTTLQLDLGTPFTPASAPSAGSALPREPQMEVVAQAFGAASRGGTMVTMEGVIEPAAVPELPTLSLMQEPPLEPIGEAVPAASPSAPVSPALSSAPPSSASLRPPSVGLTPPAALVFREQLRTLNESWARIEQTGQEIEQWFDLQRQQVIAHLERHPGVREAENPAQLSNDFLNQRLAAVDAEWAAIRKAALEISQWFGDVPAKS